MAKITYTDKVTLNEQPSISAENKVTDDDMNEIKNVVNTNDDNVGTLSNLKTTAKTSTVTAINELVDGETYSTTEVKTNKVWTNNKPIYRKVVESTLPSLQPSSGGTADGNIAHGISNFDKLVSISGRMLYSSTWFEFPILSSNQKSTAIRTVNSTNIQIRAADSWQAGPTVVFILEYTKTTD